VSDVPDPGAPVRIDGLDRDILAVLSRDARLSARAIGRELGVAAGTVGQRISRLEATGVIRGYAASIDQARLGHSLRFVVGLKLNQGAEIERTLVDLVDIPEVDEVLVITGRWDLLVIGRVADPSELHQLVTGGLWQSPSFRHSETMVVVHDRQRVRRTALGSVTTPRQPPAS